MQLLQLVCKRKCLDYDKDLYLYQINQRVRIHCVIFYPRWFKGSKVHLRLCFETHTWAFVPKICDSVAIPDKGNTVSH